LVEYGRGRPEPPVLFYDGDWDVLLISRHRDRLREAFRFVVAAPELVEDLLDKERFQALSQRLRLPVPPGLCLRADDDLESVDVPFPVVVKPLTRQHATWRPLVGAKAVAAETPQALHELWPRFAAAGIDVLVQTIVPGPETRVESYHVYVDGEGQIAAEFAGRKIRTYPSGFGYSTALELTETHDVLELGRDLVARLGLRGVAKFDFKRHPDGTLYLLEVNPRFNLWHHLGARAGVNIPAMVYADLTGRPRPAPARARAGARWCNPAHDYAAARGDGISFLAWLDFAAHADAVSGFSRSDPFPLPRAFLWRLGERVRRRTAAAISSQHRTSQA
jgi:predicted ATP-grasp superfamily ATP-dependent carboligase